MQLSYVKQLADDFAVTVNDVALPEDVEPFPVQFDFPTDYEPDEIPNGLTVEYMPRLYRLFEETPAIEDGMIVVPKRPGLGLAFDQRALERYTVS